jgi:hypothetical protein
MHIASPIPAAMICAICAICALCGCTPRVALRSVAPLQITHTQYVPIPSALLQPCRAPQATLTTWGDLAQAYISLANAFHACSSQVHAIASINPHA